MTPKVLVVCGATASGKTALSVACVRRRGRLQGNLFPAAQDAKRHPIAVRCADLRRKLLRAFYANALHAHDHIALPKRGFLFIRAADDQNAVRMQRDADRLSAGNQRPFF